MIVMRPHKIWSLFQSAACGTVQTTYDAAWATDGIPGRPIKSTSTGIAVTITGTAGMVDLVVVSHSNIWSPATITLSGDISTSIAVPAARPNNIPFNYFVLLGSPVSVDSLTVTVASNASNVVIGEILAGLSEEWNLLSDDNEGTYEIFPIAVDDSEITSVPGYSRGRERRSLRGSNYASATDYTFLNNWMAATWDNTRPSVIIPNENDNDAWVVKLNTSFSFSQIIGDPSRLYKASIGFTEFPRQRW